MATTKKPTKTKSKPKKTSTGRGVKVQDLEADRDPKGGLATSDVGGLRSRSIGGLDRLDPSAAIRNPKRFRP